MKKRPVSNVYVNKAARPFRLASGGLIVLSATLAHASPLSELAASMKPGEWRELTTNNINETLTASGASGIVFGFTEDIKWDPLSGQLFFVGGDHNDAPQFVNYKEGTNTWQRLERPAWMHDATMHGYDHSAIDVKGRSFFHRPYASSSVYQYHIDTGTWTTSAPFSSVISYTSCCAAIEWFPERQSVIYVSIENSSGGAIVEWDPAGDRWSRIAGGLPMGTLHNFAEYNPVHKVAIFGGGDDNLRAVNKVDANGKTSTQKQAPVDLGIQRSMVTVDPTSGDYLVFTRGEQFYVYDVLADTWTLQGGGADVPIWTTRYGDSHLHGVVVTPISNYGVNLFVTCDGANNCHVHLYKHAPGQAASLPESPTALSAS